jgi:16S rRNA (guanine966-N2)-methyltransferase
MPKARIIAGALRHQQFETGDLPQTRPTKDRVKESMFNQLEPLRRFGRVLDLFAGVGSLSFEAASRGCVDVTMVEKDLTTFQLLKRNQAHLKLDATLVQADAFKFLNTQTKPYDLILLDPPYESSDLEDALGQIHERRLLSPNGVIVGLHEKDISTPLYETVKTRKLGRTQITIWEAL